MTDRPKSISDEERTELLELGMIIVHIEYDATTDTETYLGIEYPDNPGVIAQ